MFGEDSKLKFFLYAAVLLTLLGYAGRYLALEPLHNQFFAFAAWAYILFADNVVYRFSGSSPAVSRTGQFAALALWSLAISCVFELLNLRLGAWYYINQPSTLSTRWTGFAFSWAAFLPSIFVTAELLRTAGLFRGLKTRPLKVTPRLRATFLAAGVLFLLLPLAAPRTFWPLIWLAFFFLAEPFNYSLGLPSLLREWEGGLPGKTLRLALAGVAAGLLWGLWNSAAGAQWGYYDKFNAGPALFGLPLPAYSVFSFFALQAYSLYSLSAALSGGRTWEEGSWPMPGPPGAVFRYAAVLSLIIISYIAFRAVDAHTVQLYVAWI